MTLQIFSFTKAIVVILVGVVSLAIPVIPGFVLILIGIRLFQKQGRKLQKTSPFYKPYKKLAALCLYGSYLSLESAKQFPLM